MTRKILRTIDDKIAAETDLEVLKAMVAGWEERGELTSHQKIAIEMKKQELQRRAK